MEESWQLQCMEEGDLIHMNPDWNLSDQYGST